MPTTLINGTRCPACGSGQIYDLWRHWFSPYGKEIVKGWEVGCSCGWEGIDDRRGSLGGRVDLSMFVKATDDKPET